ncbi:GGDEF domain-containing protein [Thalassotalea sp. LPB0316]|uniref:diguanylate cyclase n=1 Tax=Thalassotalea sp. LPB0316 TaxID=2769490 RepID=UPI001868C3C9|nr:diguanylate cyclase [Thalassotalea sp. LPB0316]QOL26422.1 GGDEF domain-containing protein [Thalassotalea sp. LPB0316]
MRTLDFTSHLNFSKLVGRLLSVFVMLSLGIEVAQAKAVNLDLVKDQAIGQYVSYFQETEQRLSIDQAITAFGERSVKHSNNDSVSLGIGVKPVWLKFSVENPSDEKRYRLAVETPWLDVIDTWLVEDGRVIKRVSGGDALPFDQRPMPYRFYAFEHSFSQGVVDIYMRVESLGPMAIPIRLSEKQQAVNRDISSGYQYGFLYGIMLALGLYNLVLFFFIRQKEYGLYGLYLIGFVANSLSYTGQLHVVFTPDLGPYFQDWLDIFLMITYSIAGLHFARYLLDTKSYAPKLDKLVIRTTVIIPTGMVIGFLLDELVFSITLAFILNCGFVTLFIAMGWRAFVEDKPFSVIFLFSSVIAALCITISSMAVAGILVPYNDYTFKAIEVGMAFEAIVLAVILAKQFRMAKLDKMIAEDHARSDALTKLNNRFGFKEVSTPIWHSLIRKERDAALVIVDIDDFKQVNDTYGHYGGDIVIKAVADCISQVARKNDIAARWGGEEFILFLPETSQGQANIQAERLRKAIAEKQIAVNKVKPFQLTVSVGVAGTELGKFNDKPLNQVNLEYMINQADKALYLAKTTGKNKVCLAECVVAS